MIFEAPQSTAIRNHNNPSVFLAGSIEMGKAEGWQTQLAKDFDRIGWDVFNPRRRDWDSSWVQTFENAHFFQQVTWELEHLKKADLIVLNLIPDTMSPISLLELGIYVESGKLAVICPEGFWRKGNVEIVCNMYSIPLYPSIESFKLRDGRARL